MKTDILLFSVLLLAGCSQNLPDKGLRMVVGTYTDSGSHGLYSYIFNEETADFHLLDSCKIVNPSYLTFSSDNKYIYSVSETNDENASVFSLSFDYESGKLDILNSQPTEGTDPCYIATNGKVVVTANYGGSMSVFPLGPDGTIAPISQLFYGSIGGPDSIRQNTPHVHCAEFSVDGSQLYATDFSADRLLVFNIDEEGGKVEPLVTDSPHQLAIELDPDNGPRHIVFDKNGEHAYVVGELSGKITVLDKKGENFIVSQIVDGDPSKGRGSADIHITPDGRFLYASNRLVNDGISIFKINQASGNLESVGYQKTGIHPRNFAITPNGKYLLCACRDSDEIQIFKIDSQTGLLSATGHRINLPHPVCVKFAP
ncbi:MAG: lactonase family protein [Muribaculaceae bacterium]|nr:lactonase family protein [Muribaculaceae bacterium]